LNSAQGVIVDQMGSVYVADSGNNRIMRFSAGSKEGSIVVGGNGEEQQPNQFNNPQGLSFDRQGNLYVADTGNSRVQKFNIISNSQVKKYGPVPAEKHRKSVETWKPLF
jgi:sugar lactone lactonase YvrE